ncbi:MAG: hypothetical protein AAF561_03680 [Planctomycetota bacterium]
MVGPIVIGVVVVVAVSQGLPLWMFGPGSGPSLDESAQRLRDAGLFTDAAELAEAIRLPDDADNAAVPFVAAFELLPARDDQTFAGVLSSLEEAPAWRAGEPLAELDTDELVAAIERSRLEQSEVDGNRRADLAKLDIDVPKMFLEGPVSVDPDELSVAEQWGLVRVGLAEVSDALEVAGTAADRRWPVEADFGVELLSTESLLEVPATHLRDARALSIYLQHAAHLAAVDGDVLETIRCMQTLLSLADAMAAANMFLFEGVTHDAIPVKSVAALQQAFRDAPTGSWVDPETTESLHSLKHRLGDESPLLTSSTNALRGESAMYFEVFEKAPNVRTLDGQSINPQREAEVATDVLLSMLTAVEAPSLQLAYDVVSSDDVARTIERERLLLLGAVLPGLDRHLRGRAGAIHHHRMARIAIALTLFRQLHGHYPPELEALVPEYLDGVPLDPLNNAEPFGYDASAGKLTSPAGERWDEIVWQLPP